MSTTVSTFAAMRAQGPADGARAAPGENPPGLVLSTLNDDGTRRWLRPRPSRGRFLTARRVVAYVLIGIFAALPLIQAGGRPLVLLDIVARRFHIFGASFYATDTLPLALLLLGLFLTIFWVTALLGRVWCGWACPQTVYMEFLFRPIERLIEGTVGRRARREGREGALVRPLKFLISLACAFALAHVFLAYFVSWSNLREWVFGSPLEHPIGFGVVMAVTAAMMFDFAYFREQVCLVACPYGRFQSVLLDRYSVIVGYDRRRGEPRGKKRSAGAVAGDRGGAVALRVLGASGSRTAGEPGDCVDCSMCVTTCPTGIDIRNGLQMECIGCAQCIDACDAVMDKLGRARGLIRYSSQAAMEGARFSVMRARVLLYPCMILAVGVLLALVLLGRGAAEVTVMRGLGQPFVRLPEGGVRNIVRVKIVNRLDVPAEFALSAAGLEGAALKSESMVVQVGARETVTVPAEIDAPGAVFGAGRAPVTVVVTGPGDFECRRPFMLLGPAGGAGGADGAGGAGRQGVGREGAR